jgi:MoxR-like ATPase
MARPGTGKTTMAETLSRVLAEDEVWIPYAVEVDGQIITVYDPAIHKRVMAWNPRITMTAGCCASAPEFWWAES